MLTAAMKKKDDVRHTKRFSFLDVNKLKEDLVFWM